MNAPYVDYRPAQLSVSLLRKGMRFCIACGLVKIGASDEAHIVKCYECWKSKEKARFFKTCGENMFTVDRQRALTAMRHGNECKECDMCKKGQTHVHPQFGIVCPRVWKDVAEESPYPF